MICAYKWEIMHELKLVHYLPIQAHKPYTIFHLHVLTTVFPSIGVSEYSTRFVDTKQSR